MSCANCANCESAVSEGQVSICRQCDQPLCPVCTLQLIIYQCPGQHEFSPKDNCYDPNLLTEIVDSCPICRRRIQLKTDATRYCHDCMPVDEAGEVSVYIYPDENKRALEFIFATFSWPHLYEAIKAIRSDEDQIICAKRCKTLTELEKNVLDVSPFYPDLLHALIASLGINVYKLGKHLGLTPFQLDFYYDATVLDFSCKRCEKQVKVAFRDLPDACTTHCSSCVDPEPPQKKNRT